MSNVRHGSSLVSAVVLALPLLAQQQQRDIHIDKEPPQSTPAPSIPRSYAVVIGIAKYANPTISELHYTEKDADAIYSILISLEGGNFRARERAHADRAKATLANIRHELEVWLPSVAQGRRPRAGLFRRSRAIVTDGTAYLAPYDLDPNNVAEPAIPWTTLGKPARAASKANGRCC